MWYIASNDSGCATLYLGIVTMLSSLSGFVTLYQVILAYDSGYIVFSYSGYAILY